MCAHHNIPALVIVWITAHRKEKRRFYKVRKNITSELNNLSFSYVSPLIVALPFMLLWLFLYSAS